MLVTPPDVISQTLLAVPMWLLFEAGLIGARFVGAPELQTQVLISKKQVSHREESNDSPAPEKENNKPIPQRIPTLPTGPKA